MRGFILISLAGPLPAAVARPFPTTSFPSDSPAAQSLLLPSTRTQDTPSTVRNTLGAGLDQGKLENGIYHVWETQSRGKRTRRDLGAVKREEHGAYHEFNGRTTLGTPTIIDESTSFQTIHSKSDTIKTSQPTPLHNLVPHWSYKKHSIAAACILIIVVIVAFTILIVMYFKKVRSFFQRRKREKESNLPTKYNSVVMHGDGIASNVHLSQEDKSIQEDKSTQEDKPIREESFIRDAWSFEINRPSPLFPPACVVQENQNLGSVIRADQACNGDEFNVPSPPHVSHDKAKVETSQPEREIPRGKLCDSAQKPVVVVSPPLTHVTSMTATMSIARGISQSDKGFSREGPTPGASSTSRHSDPGPKRTSLLPRIHRFRSPLFIFDE